MSTYTVFCVADSVAPAVVRYIGITSQGAEKRLKTLSSIALYPSQSGYNSPLAVWLRSLTVPPIIHSEFQVADQVAARTKYNELAAAHKDSVLNVLARVEKPAKGGRIGRPPKGT